MKSLYETWCRGVARAPSERRLAAGIGSFLSFWVACMLTSCTPTRHTMEPYRSDPVQGSRLSGAASVMCIDHRGADDQPPHPFTTDGCSCVPDGYWAECCVAHDIAYWCGGSAADRRRADAAFGECVSDHAGAALGFIMRSGVRVGGIPWQPAGYRWGYGWDGIIGYEEVGSGLSGADEDLPPR